MTEALQRLMAERPAAAFDVQLEDSDVDLFHERGFITVPRITTGEELDWLGRVYDALFEERRGSFKGGYFDLARPYESDGEDLLPQILMPEVRFPQLLETAFWKNGRALARRLLSIAEEEDVRGWGHMIRKPARIGEALPWHQDEAYWDPQFDYIAVGCWMPLDAATVENGCMSMIPGSHKGEIRRHRHINDDPNVHGLETDLDPAEAALAVPLPAPAGGAVLHHPRMLHCSGPNVSDRVRRAYANEWQCPPVPRATPYDRPWQVEGTKAFAARNPVQ